MLKAETIKYAEMKEEIRKADTLKTRKHLKANLCSRNLIKKNKHLGNFIYQIFGTILKMYNGRNLYKWIQGQESWGLCINLLISETTKDRLFGSRKKENDDLPALRIASMHQYGVSRNTLKEQRKQYWQNKFGEKNI